MTGLWVACIAGGLLFLLLKFNVSVSAEELEELDEIKKAEQAEKAAKAAKAKKEKALKDKEENPEKETEKGQRRVIRDRATELLVQVMEDGSVAEIQQAMSNGINILQKLENDQTLLMIAVKNNPSVEVVQFLLDQGIEINAVDGNGQTALILAAMFNTNPEVILTLLNNGADKTIKVKSKTTASDYVVLNSSFFGTDIPTLLKQ